MARWRIAGGAGGPRILCHVPHFYGPATPFRGGSVRTPAPVRRAMVERTLAALRALPGRVEVRVCGLRPHNLVPVDLDFGGLADPRLLVYEALAALLGQAERYDYLVAVEDDVRVPPATWANVLAFDREGLVNECLHPTRVEWVDGRAVSGDLLAIPGWTTHQRTFGGRTLRVALNPHSAVLILSRAKARYALRHVDLAYRGRMVGDYMASAFAHVHQPFALYRCPDDLLFHHVEHLDVLPGSVPPAAAGPEPGPGDRMAALEAEAAGLRDELRALERTVAVRWSRRLMGWPGVRAAWRMVRGSRGPASPGARMARPAGPG